MGICWERSGLLAFRLCCFILRRLNCLCSVPVWCLGRDVEFDFIIYCVFIMLFRITKDFTLSRKRNPFLTHQVYQECRGRVIKRGHPLIHIVPLLETSIPDKTEDIRIMIITRTHLVALPTVPIKIVKWEWTECRILETRLNITLPHLAIILTETSTKVDILPPVGDQNVFQTLTETKTACKE